MVKNKKVNFNKHSLKGLNILIADDEDFLEESGANLVYVVNGQEAVEKSKLFQFDVILMDIRMPIMDGIEAINIIKKFENIPIIAVCAYNYDIQRSEKGIVKYDYYIEKPISQSKLYDQILKAINLN